MNAKDFKKDLAECIRVGGQMMIDNAEDIVGKMDFMTSLEISFTFDREYKYVPEMTIKRSHIPELDKIDKILSTFYPVEKNDIPSGECSNDE